MKTCPNCGHDNRQNAKFCAVCGTDVRAVIPGYQPPLVMQPKNIPPSPTPSQGQGLIPIAVANSQTLNSPMNIKGIVGGTVITAKRIEDQPMPLDVWKAVTMVGLFVVVAALIVSGATVMFFLLAIVAALGCSGSLLLGSWALFVRLLPSPLRMARNNDDLFPLCEATVRDDNGYRHNIQLYLNSGSTELHNGDLVDVRGIRKRSKDIWAWSVDVYSEDGSRIERTVSGYRPWPWWVALVSNVIVIGLAIWVYVELFP